MGLPPDAFRVTDVNLISPPALSADDEPLSVAILIDTSSSMQAPDVKEVGRAKPIIDAINHFLELSNPGNEYFVMTFDRDAQVVLDWRQGKKLPSLDVLPPKDPHLTALYDAGAAALTKLKEGHHNKRVVLLFSDGLDSGSKTRYADLRRSLERTDVLIYAFAPRAGGHLTTDLNGILRAMVTREGEHVLGEMVQATGGFVYYPGTTRELMVAAERIAIEVRHQYRLTFRLKSGGSGAPVLHRTKLEVTPPANVAAEHRKLNVRVRRGYYAP
jgi:VWFA-related protein